MGRAHRVRACRLYPPHRGARGASGRAPARGRVRRACGRTGMRCAAVCAWRELDGKSDSLQPFVARVYCVPKRLLIVLFTLLPQITEIRGEPLDLDACVKSRKVCIYNLEEAVKHKSVDTAKSKESSFPDQTNYPSKINMNDLIIR